MNSTIAQRSAFIDGWFLYKFQDKPKLLIAGKRLARVSVVSSSQKTDKSIKVGILGASGYNGSELVGLIANHPFFDISLMTADTEAGQSIGSLFPHLNTHDLPSLVALNDADFSSVDAVFCCLPHGTSQEIIKGLPSRLKIVDLSGDFILRDVKAYVEVYGQPHKAPELQKKAAFGLPEIHRKKIQSARLVANPGCYPTAGLLPLVPLIRANLIASQDILIISNSGVIETVPEINQELSDAASLEVHVDFFSIQELMGGVMNLTINVKVAPGDTIEDLRQHLKGFYEKEEFVAVLPGDEGPQIKNVLGSNACHISVCPTYPISRNNPGRALIISLIDKHVKGAGQALQNLNLMMGIPENIGLRRIPLSL